MTKATSIICFIYGTELGALNASDLEEISDQGNDSNVVRDVPILQFLE